MRSIPPQGSLPPAARQREIAAARSTHQARPRGSGPPTKRRRRGRRNYWSIKTWTFEEKPSFRRLPARLRVRRVHQPDVDVHDEARHIVVIANLPGVKREDLEIDVHGDILAIEATRKDRSGHVHHYHRELLLPIEVHDAPVDVTFDNSLLEVRLKPQVEKREARKRHGKTSRT